MWGTMQHYIPTPTLDGHCQVASVGNYPTLYTHAYTGRTSRQCGELCNATYAGRTSRQCGELCNTKCYHIPTPTLDRQVDSVTPNATTTLDRQVASVCNTKCIANRTDSSVLVLILEAKYRRNTLEFGL